MRGCCHAHRYCIIRHAHYLHTQKINAPGLIFRIHHEFSIWLKIEMVWISPFSILFTCMVKCGPRLIEFFSRTSLFPVRTYLVVGEARSMERQEGRDSPCGGQQQCGEASERARTDRSKGHASTVKTRFGLKSFPFENIFLLENHFKMVIFGLINAVF